jgi:hypothetical protein
MRAGRNAKQSDSDGDGVESEVHHRTWVAALGGRKPTFRWPVALCVGFNADGPGLHDQNQVYCQVEHTSKKEKDLKRGSAWVQQLRYGCNPDAMLISSSLAEKAV